MSGNPLGTGAREPMDDAAVARLVRAYKSEAQPSVNVLAKRFGHSHQTIKRVLEEQGVQIIGRRRL